MRTGKVNMRSTRRAGKADSKGRGRKKAWGLWWSAGANPTKVHFSLPEQMYCNLPGTEFESKDPWKVGYQHYVKQARQGQGGYTECGPTCLVCAYTNPQAFDLDIEINTALAKCYRNMTIGVSGWIEEWYHLVPGQTDDGRKYHNRLICEKRGCKHCEAGHPKVFGNRFYTRFSYPVWRAVFEPLMEKVQCYCRCGGNLLVFNYLCEECKEPVVDFLNRCAQCGNDTINVDLDEGTATCDKCNSEWSIYESDDQALADLVLSDVKCQACGHSGMPVPNLDCATSSDKCTGKPDPYNIYDIQMVIRKVDKRTEITKWKITEPDSRLFDPEFQGEGKGEGAAEVAQIAAERNKLPIDLEEAFAPNSAAEQAQYLGVADPWGGSASTADAKRRTATKNYGDDKDDSDNNDKESDVGYHS